MDIPTKIGKIKRNIVYWEGASSPSVLVPENFTPQKRSGKSGAPRVSLAELASNRDAYVGKIIEVEGDLNKGGHQFTSVKTRAEGGIGDGQNFLVVVGAKFTGSGLGRGHRRHVVLLGYFYKEMMVHESRWDPVVKAMKPRYEMNYYFKLLDLVSAS